MNTHSDTLIVGGGIGGAALALALGRWGYRVTLIERLPHFPTIYKGEFLQPYTLALLDQLGVLSDVAAHCTPVMSHTYGLDGNRRCFTVRYDELEIPIRYGLNGHHRHIHGAVLDAACRLPNVTFLPRVTARQLLFAGNEVIGVQADTPEGPAQLRARVVVGADGIHSLVRQQLPVRVRLDRYEQRARVLGFTLRMEAQPVTEASFLFGVGVGAAYFPLPNGEARCYLVLTRRAWEQVESGGLASIRSLTSQFYPHLDGSLAALTDRAQIQTIPAYFLRTRPWVTSGAALLGDACHSLSPALGQGMNLAIQDALALAEVLHESFRTGRFDAQALGRYEAERRPYVELVQRVSLLHSFLWFAQHPLARAVRDRALSRLGRCPSVCRRQLAIVAGYRQEPLTVADWLRILGLLRAR